MGAVLLDKSLMCTMERPQLLDTGPESVLVLHVSVSTALAKLQQASCMHVHQHSAWHLHGQTCSATPPALHTTAIGQTESEAMRCMQ